MELKINLDEFNEKYKNSYTLSVDYDEFENPDETYKGIIVYRAMNVFCRVFTGAGNFDVDYQTARNSIPEDAEHIFRSSSIDDFLSERR